MQNGGQEYQDENIMLLCCSRPSLVERSADRSSGRGPTAEADTRSGKVDADRSRQSSNLSSCRMMRFTSDQIYDGVVVWEPWIPYQERRSHTRSLGGVSDHEDGRLASDRLR